MIVAVIQWTAVEHMHGDLNWLAIVLALAEPRLWVAGVLTVLLFFDGWSTYQAFKVGAYEKNTLVADWIEDFGLYTTLVVLKGGSIALAWAIVLLPTADDSFAIWIRDAGLVGVSAFFGWVAWNNWGVLQRRRARQRGGL